MRKVTEKTFKAYAKEAVKQLNTLEIRATLSYSCMGAEISLYREGSALVGRISISFDGSASAKDWVRNENFDIEPLHDTMKDLFNAVYEAVNSRLDDNGFKTEEVEEQETAKQYFVVNYEKDGIFHANIASAEKKSDVEAKYSEYDAFAVVEANDYIVKEAKIKHMPIIEVEPVKQEGRNKMESVKPLSIKVERAISKMALGDCTLTGVTELSDYCHDIYVTIETGKDRYELKVILKRNIDGVTTIAIVEDEADEATHVFTDRGCMSLDTIAYRTKTLVEGMYAQRMFDMPCEITDPEYFKEHQGDIEEQIEEKEEEAEEPQPTPEEADREVTYIDFKPEQDYSEEEQKEIAETAAGVGLELLEEQLTELEKLEEESDKADDAWDKDPLNAELEAASDKAYEKEWKQYMDTVKTLAKLINTDTKTARQMLQRGSRNREKVWNYLKRRKIYESK